MKDPTQPGSVARTIYFLIAAACLALVGLFIYGQYSPAKEPMVRGVENGPPRVQTPTAPKP